MALTEYQLQLYNRPIDHFADLLRRERKEDSGYKFLRLDATYQRGSVWDEQRRRNLIRSVLEGIPIGAIYLNFRKGHPHQAWVVDGKQRIEALVGFENGEFAIAAEWVSGELLAEDVEPDAMVTFTQLSEKFQRGWGMVRTVAVYESRLPDEAREAALFDRINFGGCLHDQQQWRVTEDDPEGMFQTGQIVSNAVKVGYNIPAVPV